MGGCGATSRLGAFAVTPGPRTRTRTQQLLQARERKLHLRLDSRRANDAAPLRTLVDRALAAFDEVWAAGGIAHAVFPTTFDELVTVTGGEPADVA